MENEYYTAKFKNWLTPSGSSITLILYPPGVCQDKIGQHNRWCQNFYEKQGKDMEPQRAQSSTLSSDETRNTLWSQKEVIIHL